MNARTDSKTRIVSTILRPVIKILDVMISPYYCLYHVVSIASVYYSLTSK